MVRTILGGVLATALVAGSAGVGTAAPAAGAMPQCSAANGPVVWQASGSKTTVAKGAPGYGKGHGRYVCRGPMRAASNAASQAAGTAAPVVQPPASGGNTSPGSGNQGNTGAPGAGGQVPNNPASSSNSTSPSPQSSPRP